MTAEDREYQARTFQAWYAKLGGDLNRRFRWWAGTKKLSQPDRRAIWQAVRKLGRAEEGRR